MEDKIKNYLQEVGQSGLIDIALGAGVWTWDAERVIETLVNKNHITKSVVNGRVMYTCND